MDNIFIYDIDDTRGIVLANTEIEAKEKVIKAYQNSGYREYDFSGIKIYKAIESDGYLTKYPDVLEVTE